MAEEKKLKTFQEKVLESEENLLKILEEISDKQRKFERRQFIFERMLENMQKNMCSILEKKMYMFDQYDRHLIQMTEKIGFVEETLCHVFQAIRQNEYLQAYHEGKEFDYQPWKPGKERKYGQGN
jgi:hypothetical protein